MITVAAVTPHAAAAGVLFSDPSRSESGTLRRAAGGVVAIRLVCSRPDPELELGGQHARNPGYRMDVRAEALTTTAPVKGDLLDRDTDGLTYRVTSVEREPIGGWFTLDVDRT